MASITLPYIDFENLSGEVTEKRFPSKKISTFAQKRIEELIEQHKAITRNFQDFQKGNKASKGLVLSGIEEIFKKCTENYPVSSKVRQLKELKTLLAPIEQEYCAFRDLLTEEERSLEEAEKVFISDCGKKKSQLLRNEQEDYEKSPLFHAFLEKIAQKFNECQRETIYFTYARPTDSQYEKESWIQPFLKNLQAHLEKAGFPTVQLDIVSNRYGANIYEFMKEAETSGYVLLFGTESLLDMFSEGTSTVCTELIHILRKREDDGKENIHRVFPILLSGEHRSAFPPEYERFSTIRDWRDHSYLHNFQQLFLELLDLPPEAYQPKLSQYWREILKEKPNENPPIADWYQEQRRMIDDCRRKRDVVGLASVQVESLQTCFTDRLKEHYTTRSTITILTFREKGKWVHTLPVESLYTKLAMITEEERDERRNLSKLVDERLPTHETIFKAKKVVATDEIFKLAKGKRAVIYGSAGIGKTTFSTMLLYKWAKGELFTEFQTVFCVRLRNLTKNFYPKSRDYGAADILKQEYRSLGLDHIESDPQTTLLILDGWDELPPETREGGHLAQAFQELQDYYPNLLITSRPGAINIEATEFEILGFSDEQIEVYIDQFFHTDVSKAVGIKSFIQQNPLARSLAHIPINLSILCALYDQDDTLFSSATLLTNSALYDRIINQFYKIFLLRKGISQNEVRSSSLLSMHPKVRSLTSCLEEIAYSAALKEEIYTNEREVTQIVYRKKLEVEGVRKLGLFRIENRQGSFIHLTFQEYFAALHISRLYESPETRFLAWKIVRKIKFKGKFVRILSMVAGILSNIGNQEALQSYFNDLYFEPRDFAEIYELTLLARCFEECDCPSNLSQYADFIEKVKRWINSFPLEDSIIILFRGNQKLLFHRDIVTLFNELLSHKNSQENLLSVLRELTPYSAKLPPEIFQKLENCLHEEVSHRDIISILGNIAGEKVMKTLISLVTDPGVSQDVCNSAAFALGKMASLGQRIGEKGVKALISFIADTKVVQYERDSTVFALGRISEVGEGVGTKGIEAIISLASDAKVPIYVSSSAASVLEKIASTGERIGEKGIEALVSLVADSKVSQDVRKSAAFVIGEVVSGGEKVEKKEVEVLISLIADRMVSPEVRSSVASAIGKIASAGEEIGDKGVKALVSLVSNPKVSQSVRRLAAFALGKIASVGEELAEKVVEALISLISDSKVSQDVRSSVASVLRNIALSGGGVGKKRVKALISLVKNPRVSQDVRKSSASALGEIASSGECLGEKAVEALISLVADLNVDLRIRSSAAFALGEVASSGEGVGEKGVGTLISLVEDSKISKYVQWSSAFALGEIASAGESVGEKGVGTLISLVADPNVDKYVFDSAVEALGKIASLGQGIGKKGVETLISFVSDPNVAQGVLFYVAGILREIASSGERIGEKGVESLISLVANPEVARYVRSSAAEALGKIVSSEEGIGKKGVDILLSLFADPKIDQDVLKLAVKALGDISPDDIIKNYPENVEFFKLYCRVNQRGLTRKNEEWIITDQIK